MDTLDELRAIERIKQLKARYFRCMDTKDWDGFQAVFAADATLDTTEEAPEVEVVHGAPNIRQFVEGMVGPVVTVHHGHMPEIEITSPTTARGIWAMQDFLQIPEGSPLGMKSMTGWGHYTETYELVDGTWLIKTLVLTRLRRDVETGVDVPADDATLRPPQPRDARAGASSRSTARSSPTTSRWRTCAKVSAATPWCCCTGTRRPSASGGGTSRRSPPPDSR